MYESKGCNLRTYDMSAGMGALKVEINVDTTTEVFLPCDEELVLEDWKPVPVARKEEARPLKGATKELVAIELDVGTWATQLWRPSSSLNGHLHNLGYEGHDFGW